MSREQLSVIDAEIATMETQLAGTKARREVVANTVTLAEAKFQPGTWVTVGMPHIAGKIEAVYMSVMGVLCYKVRLLFPNGTLGDKPTRELEGALSPIPQPAHYVEESAS